MYPILLNLPVWPLLLLGGSAATHLLILPQGLKGMTRGFAAVAGGLVLLIIGVMAGWSGGQFPIRGYGSMVLLGFLLAIYMSARRAPLIGLDPGFCLDLGLWGLMGGLIGSRLFYVIEFWPQYSPTGKEGFRALLGIFEIWRGGLVFYGGLFASVLTGWWYCRVNKVRYAPMLDLASPSFMMGLALGRVGCLLNGCCFGKTCTLPWAIHFPPGSPAYDDYYKTENMSKTAYENLITLFPHTPPLQPTQIYAMIGALICMVFLYVLWPRRMYDGFLFGLMLVMAGTTRFFEEIMRADNPVSIPELSATFTVAQWIGIGMVVIGLGWIAYFRRKPELLSNIQY